MSCVRQCDWAYHIITEEQWYRAQIDDAPNGGNWHEKDVCLGHVGDFVMNIMGNDALRLNSLRLWRASTDEGS